MRRRRARPAGTAGQQVRPVIRMGRVRMNNSSPTPMITRLAMSRFRGPNRAASGSAKRSDIAPHHDRGGQERQADAKSVVVQDALQVQRTHEEHAEHRGQEQRLDDVRADTLRERNNRSGISGSAIRACRTTNPARARPTPRRARSCAAMPSRTARPRRWRRYRHQPAVNATAPGCPRATAAETGQRSTTEAPAPGDHADRQLTMKIQCQ